MTYFQEVEVSKKDYREAMEDRENRLAKVKKALERENGCTITSFEVVNSIIPKEEIKS